MPFTYVYLSTFYIILFFLFLFPFLPVRSVLYATRTALAFLFVFKKGPGGILDDPEVLWYGGRFHLFHSRKALQAGDTSCTNHADEGSAVAALSNNTKPAAPTGLPSHCVEWRTSVDGTNWERRGVLTPPATGAAMSETMSAQIYPNNTLVIITDGHGMIAFTTNATGLLGNDV